jgi:hypothetical protein
MAFTMVGMASSDYVGPKTPPIAGGSIPFLLTLAYPFVAIMTVVVAWILHCGRHYRAAFWVSLIPLANILLVVLGLELLSRAVAKQYRETWPRPPLR